MTIFLQGIAAQFYRGIGAETQFIAPFSRVNFFVGPNNSGKSIVLNLIAGKYREGQGENLIKTLNEAEVYRAKQSGSFVIAIGTPIETILTKFMKKHQITTLQQLKIIINKLSVDGMIWVKYTSGRIREVFPSIDLDAASRWGVDWRNTWGTITAQSGGGFEHWIPESISKIVQAVEFTSSSIHLIPAKREIGKSGQIFDDLTGKGLIDHLAELQAPNFDKQIDREKFGRINRFLQEVTGKSEARLEVPHSRNHILVHIDNKVLPFSSLGTGIHEVILIAAFCTIHDGSIMCIEEPEIHLHPILQRKLINYLVATTSSQYFIATHSAAFIDTPDASIFRVTNDGEQTRIKAVVTKGDKRAILDDLGYQASDLLQANAVIWVEGPSDRIYLNHWIRAASDNLHEGIHYSIMFYGGSLIRHLSASDDALTDFIKLRDLNRNMAVVIDSDRADATAPLKPHAQRLVDEVGKDGGIVWVTDGREMENYINGDKIQSALKILHPKLYISAGKSGKYDNSFHFFRESPKSEGSKVTYKDADKVGLAGLICKEEADLGILDLKDRIHELTQMIQKANGRDS